MGGVWIGYRSQKSKRVYPLLFQSGLANGGGGTARGQTMGGREKIPFHLGRKKALMLDYLRLSPMIGGGSLLLKANKRERVRIGNEQDQKALRGLVNR